MPSTIGASWSDRHRYHPGRRIGGAALIGAFVAAFLVPAVASAHPLGNFTINHYAGIRVEPDRMPTSTSSSTRRRSRPSANGNGSTRTAAARCSDEEIEAERQVACGRLGPSLDLSVGGTSLPLTVVAAGPLIPRPARPDWRRCRLVCEYVATPVVPLPAGATIRYADPSNADHLGWHEIVATGDGTTVVAKGIPTTSISKRLTAYPPALIPKPLAVSSATITATPGGPATVDPCVPDAFLADGPTDGRGGVRLRPSRRCADGRRGLARRCGGTRPGIAGSRADRGGVCRVRAGRPAPAAGAPTDGVVAAVPGGVGADVSGLLETSDVTPTVLVLSLLTAIALGPPTRSRRDTARR